MRIGTTPSARFACSVEEYNLELNRVIDHPAALHADPLVVRRLRRHASVVVGRSSMARPPANRPDEPA